MPSLTQFMGWGPWKLLKSVLGWEGVEAVKAWSGPQLTSRLAPRYVARLSGLPIHVGLPLN